MTGTAVTVGRRIGLTLSSAEPDVLRERHLLTACILCGSQVFGNDHATELPWLARCGGCGLSLVSPQPTDAELAEIYDDQYYRTFGFDSTDGAGYRTLKQATIERFLRLAERLAKPPGRLLDVGSAVGDVLAVGRRRGWEVRGVEPNPYGAAAADSLAPGATFGGTFEQLPLDEGPFQLVTCLDVLEHLRRPDLAIKKMHSLLSPSGILLLAVPDVGSWLARLLGARWPHYHRDHLWYFSRRALRRLLEERGFEVVRQGASWKTFNLQYVLGILAANPNSGLFHRIAANVKDRLPRWLLRLRWPMIPEGQMVIARKSTLAIRDDGVEFSP